MPQNDEKSPYDPLDPKTPKLPPEYTPYNHDNPSEYDQECITSLYGRDRNDITTAKDLNTFSCLMHERFQKICYESHHLWSQDLSQSFLYWINQDHAKKIAHELTYDMEYFHLCFTKFEKGAWKVLLKNIPEKTPTIKKIVFHHMSGDEVTLEEVESIVKLVDILHSESLTLWATEFDLGTIELLGKKLKEYNIPHLHKVEVCDTSKPDGEDKIYIDFR